MKKFKKHTRFKVFSSTNLEEKMKNYFSIYNFKSKKNSENEFVFFKKSSFFEGWKFNPLHWESTIKITIKDNKVYLSYFVEGLYITPFAFSKLYNSFIDNFENYIIQNKKFEVENSNEIKLAKTYLIRYYLVILTGILIGVIGAKLSSNYFDTRIIGFLIIISCARMSEVLLNKYLSKKYYSL